MAVKIEKGGKILIFVLGLGLIAYGLNKYGYLDLGSFGSKSPKGGLRMPRWIRRNLSQPPSRDRTMSASA